MKKVLFSPPIERIVFNALLLTRSFAFPTMAGAVAGSGERMDAKGASNREKLISC